MRRLQPPCATLSAYLNGRPRPAHGSRQCPQLGAETGPACVEPQQDVVEVGKLALCGHENLGQVRGQGRMDGAIARRGRPAAAEPGQCRIEPAPSPETGAALELLARGGSFGTARLLL